MRQYSLLHPENMEIHWQNEGVQDDEALQADKWNFSFMAYYAMV